MLLEQLKQKHVKRKVKSRIQEVVTPQPQVKKSSTPIQLKEEVIEPVVKTNKQLPSVNSIEESIKSIQQSNTEFVENTIELETLHEVLNSLREWSIDRQKQVNENAKMSHVVRELQKELHSVRELVGQKNEVTISEEVILDTVGEKLDKIELKLNEQKIAMDSRISDVAASSKGSGEVRILGMDDVDPTGITSGDALKYDDTTKKFKKAPMMVEAMAIALGG